METCQALERFPNVTRIWFNDEKSFTIRSTVNAQNNHVYSAARTKREITPERLLTQRYNFSKKAMISCYISKIGKSDVIYVEISFKMNALYYCNMSLTDMYQKFVEFTEIDFTFQQDGATSNTAGLTVEY